MQEIKKKGGVQKPNTVVKKLKKRKQHKPLIIHLQTPESIYSEAKSVFLHGDIFIPLSNGLERSNNINRSNLNHYKTIVSITNKKNLKVAIELNLSAKVKNSLDCSFFIKLLLSQSSQELKELSDLLKAYFEFIKIKFPSCDNKYADAPLLDSIQNYRDYMEEQLLTRLYPKNLPYFYMKYYFNPFSKEMRLAVMGYSEQFFNLLGASIGEMNDIFKQYGIFDFLHPNSYIRQVDFIFECKLTFGITSSQQLLDLELCTFDGMIVPFKLKIENLYGKPNMDGYFEVYFIFELLVSQNMMTQIAIVRANNFKQKSVFLLNSISKLNGQKEIQKDAIALKLKLEE